ncbi:MAG: homoserine O-acetyltransferase [Bacteroidota bacterium]
MRYLHLDHPFTLESGEQLDRLTITYTTHGKLNERRDNVVWICHALTANSDPVEWWPGLVGEGEILNPEQHFIVCANMLGSCYGSTGPKDYRPGSGQKYGLDFPLVTTRDMARLHQLLAKYLGINSIYLGLGGSMGGQQLLEWAVMAPTLFEYLCPLATNTHHSPWGIAFNEAQRMAMQADETLGTDSPEAGKKGLEAARAIAMLSYRHYRTYEDSQSEQDAEKLDNYRASSYQRYQGKKLWDRFDPASYWVLSRAMDSHHLGRGRASITEALAGIKSKTMVIGIDTDILFPVAEQSEIAQMIPNARFEVIPSDFGHDGFLTETKSISLLLRDFLKGTFNGRRPSPTLRKNAAFKHNLVIPGSEPF